MQIQLTGSVLLHPSASKSKNGYIAILFKTPTNLYVLRQVDKNPLEPDPVLEQLVGKEIRAVGENINYTFIISEWEII